MKRLIILGILCITAIVSFSQEIADSSNLKIRIINMSKYQIEKLVISDSVTIESIRPGCFSDFIRIEEIHSIFKYDLTFSNIKKNIFDPIRFTIKSQPIDFHGEQLFKSGTLEFILTIDKESRKKYIVEFQRKK